MSNGRETKHFLWVIQSTDVPLKFSSSSVLRFLNFIIRVFLSSYFRNFLCIIVRIFFFFSVDFIVNCYCVSVLLLLLCILLYFFVILLFSVNLYSLTFFKYIYFFLIFRYTIICLWSRVLGGRVSWIDVLKDVRGLTCTFQLMNNPWISMT